MFNEIIDRKNTNALSVEGFKDSLFPGKSLESNKDYIRMWVADMDFGVDENILNAIRNRLDKKILGYTKLFDNRLYLALKKWSNEKYSWDFTQQNLFLADGVVPSISALVKIILKDDEKALIFTPSYSPFKRIVRQNNKGLVTLPLKRDENNFYSIDFLEFEETLRLDSKIKLCIFCSPHNPTGRLWNEEELLKVGSICKEYGLYLISDEIHCDLLRSNEKHIPLARLFNNDGFIITAQSVSKTFNLAGLMFSHNIIFDEKIIKEYVKIYNNSCSPLSLEASIAAFESGGPWLDELKKYLDSNFLYLKNFLDKNFPKTNFSIPKSTYLAWINISPYLKNIENVGLIFAKNALLLEDESRFVNNAEGFVRLNIAQPLSQLKNGLEVLKHTLESKY